eukprot:2462240-Rhodomonas_salina.1
MPPLVVGLAALAKLDVEVGVVDDVRIRQTQRLIRPNLPLRLGERPTRTNVELSEEGSWSVAKLSRRLGDIKLYLTQG